MANKRERLKKIDQRPAITGGGLVVIQEDNIAPPAIREIPAPDTLVFVTSGIQRASQAPLAFVSIAWQEAPNVSPDYYNVEWDEDSAFTNVQRKRASQISATIEGLKVNTVYHFRVQAVLGGVYSGYSNTLDVLTPVDLTVPPEVTSPSATFKDSDLIIAWSKPLSDELYKDAEIRIYNAAHTVLVAGPFISGSESFVWTAEQNIAATGNVPLTSVSVDIRSRSWSNVYSPGVNVTASSTAPSAPTVIVNNWAADTGLADEDFTLAWNTVQNAASYVVILDGVSFETTDTRFTYKYDKNVSDHVPTVPSGDASFVWTIQAKSKLKQTSTTTSGVATNVAPPSGVLNLQATVGFSQIAANVGLLASSIIQDFDHYEWALVSGAITQQSFISTTPDVIIIPSGSGTYGIQVRAVDKFNQKSSPVTISGLVVDALTIAELRAETRYLDSLGATSPTLDFYKDGFLHVGSSKTYSAVASGTYNWIEAQRPLLDRYKTVTFDATYGGITLCYLSFDDANGNTVWYAGPVSTGTSGQKVLTSFATEALAKAQAFRLDLLGTSRIDLPSIIEARKVRIYFSNYGGSLQVWEYYPRRLIQSDDIEAENIKTINLAVGAVTADRISVINLQAVSANMGNLHMDGVIDISTLGGIYQGTGTFASPTTGLKVFNSGGVGKLSTYNTGVEQITLDTDGVLKAGAGTVRLDENGIELTPGSNISPVSVNAIRWRSPLDGGGTSIGKIYALRSTVSAANDAFGIYRSRRDNSHITSLNLTETLATFSIDSGAGTYSFGSTTATFLSGLDVGSSMGAAAGEIRASSLVRVDTANATNALFQLANAGTVKWSLYRPASTNHFYIDQSGVGARMVFDSNSNIGVGGTFTPTALLDVINGYIRARDGSNVPPSADAGLELVMTGGAGYMISYNRTSSAYLPLNVSGSTLNIGHSGIADIFIGANGRIGIGVGSEPSVQKVVIRGENTANTSYALLVQNSTPANLVRVRNDGALNETVVAWTLFSDRSLKENIEPLRYGLNDILQLKPIKFDFIEGAKQQLGFIAQEVEQVIPELITINEEGIYGMRYESLTAPLVNAIKQLDSNDKALERRIAALEQRI